MALGDLYEASVYQDIDSEEVYNVFHFESLSTASGASDLALRILNQWIIANWRTLVGLGVSFVEIAVRNLFDQNDQVDYPVGVVGAVAGELMPPHDCLTMNCSPELAEINTGSKRFSGLVEGDQVGGLWNNGALTNWQDFIDNKITQPLIGTGGGASWHYVIVKRIKYTTPSGSIAYRLPENAGEADFSRVVACVTNPAVRTQGTRDFLE